MKKLRRMLDLTRFLFVQRVKGFEVADEPWLDAETLVFLKQAIAEADTYLEFGAGGSTRLAGRSGTPTTTVECDRFFARAVRAGLAEGHKVTILDADIGTTIEWGVPLRGKPNDARVAKWRTYIEVPFRHIASVGRPFPDIVLVDGRFRRACALATALEAGKAGASTTLVFDDYFDNERRGYRKVEELLGQPERLGRSALFSIASDNRVTQSDVDEAIRDFH